jgi:glycopeptide antibiotics resistance protein
METVYTIEIGGECMRVEEIILMLQRNVMFALTMTIIVGLIIFLGYRFIYLKKFGGSKRLSTKQWVVFVLFTLYVVTVCTLTLLNRGANYGGSSNLSLFSSYREAWYNFSLRGWQYIYFNILMFVPLGFLLPLIHKRFVTIGWTLLAALVFTAFIEIMQYLTSFGIFELDDLFNNVLGALIGFGLVKVLMVKNWWKRIMYLMPLLLVVGLSAGMFTYYEQKEFGNLPIVPVNNVKMKDVRVTTSISLHDDPLVANVYRAPSMSKGEAKQFAFDFFRNMELDTSNIEIIGYQNEANYRYHGEPSYFIWLHFLDGTYELTDFSSFDIELADTDEATIKMKLKEYGVTIPEQAKFERTDTGRYQWVVDQLQTADQLIDGTITADYYKDGTVKRINHQIVTYEKVKEVNVKSVQQAYEELLDGKFKLFNRNIRELDIQQVELGYVLDSKGFYQPVHVFSGTIDGASADILVPALN